MPRRVLSSVLAILAAIALSLSLASGYAKRALFDSDQFANRAAAALDNEAVRDQLSTRVTDDLVLKADPDLIGLRPVIRGAVSGLVGDSAFQSLFRAAVKDVHAAIFRGDKDTVTLTLADVGTLAAGAVQALDPQAARKVEDNSKAPVLEISPPPAVVDVADAAQGLSPLPWLLLLLAAALLVAALWASPDVRGAVVQEGTAIAVAGILRTCERIRNHIPNLIAVDFHRTGDLGDVIDELNGVRAAKAGEWRQLSAPEP